jgi:uncharacterized SAM-binding protein YcdF (DUF218 family)
MSNFLGTIKWLLLVVAILGWLVLCLVNIGVAGPFILIPGYLEYPRVPVPVLLIFPFIVAFVVLVIVGMLDQIDHFIKERELRKRIRDLEQEVDQLRNLPIREGLLSQSTVERENRG